jgi:signal transduction histidine kinase
MGMGLSISRSIIESHGGRLRMFQRVASGATFVFDLPTGGHDPSHDAG